MAQGRRTTAATAALCLVQFVDVLGVTVVVTALPSMLASLHAGAGYGSVIATSYAMFFGGLLLLGARLGDRYGHRRTILAGLALFAVGAVAAATAQSVAALAAGRCLQGAAAAVSVPSALRLLTTITAAGPDRTGPGPSPRGVRPAPLPGPAGSCSVAWSPTWPADG